MPERFSARFTESFPGLTSEQLVSLDHFETLVLERAMPRGLVGFEAENVGREIARSLLLVPLLVGPGPTIDVGSGAGFPGIPLCIATEWETYLVDSKRRSAMFLELAVREIDLSASVRHGQAELLAVGDLREKGSSVVARALARLSAALELTVPMCGVGGRVVITAGRDTEFTPTPQLLGELGVGPLQSKRLTGPLDLVQHVHIMDKLKTTPNSYPRPPGRARKPSR